MNKILAVFRTCEPACNPLAQLPGTGLIIADPDLRPDRRYGCADRMELKTFIDIEINVFRIRRGVRPMGTSMSD